ncbi:hypothetical protein [Methanogenium organophilum]|uniref:Uncharacterized protein n=1 Tax=Methanogenium organophilum TaxID=2199 RepID=A0A9X9S690_METOG|nr:hypothetical protein [Methanogenium organophilum]WAI02190.1 hypothetical protein OU421_04775 [Methanogenium organophilum]
MNTRYLTVGALMALLFLSAGVAAFQISGEYTEEGMAWLNEHWGENITVGDVARIAYTTENYEKMKANVEPELLEEMWSRPYHWGSRQPGYSEEHPECPFGATACDENGPVNIRELNLSQKQEMGLENAVTDTSGYIVIGYMDKSIKEGEMKPFHRRMPENLSRFTYDLLWGNTEDSLKLTIFAPDGVMGPYYDDSDGRKNGRIYLQISRPDGIEPGDWYAVVEGEQVDGTCQFMLLVV